MNRALHFSWYPTAFAFLEKILFFEGWAVKKKTIINFFPRSHFTGGKKWCFFFNASADWLLFVRALRALFASL